MYLYEADGSPIGMQYRNTSYAEGVFDTYWFEKNLQGDIVAVYNQAGTKLIAYTYDAWGNASITYSNGGASTTATYNPFRYRGYYFDSESGFYYLNSRYMILLSVDLLRRISLQRLKQHHLMLVTNIIFTLKNQKRRFNGAKIQENSNKIFIQNQRK